MHRYRSGRIINMTTKMITARGHTFSADLYVVKKRFNPIATHGCTICGGLYNVSPYAVKPQQLLDNTTDWNAGVRKATWKLLPEVSMDLCDDCIKEHSRFKIGRGIAQMLLCAGITALCSWLTALESLVSIQWVFNFIRWIAVLGVFTGLIDILATLSGAKKKKRPQPIDGKVCVRDLIEPLYEGHKFKINW